MKPLQHAQISAKTYGGVWTDYIELHNFLDSSKSSCAHFKHRFLLHHIEGIDLAVRLFGEKLTNNNGQTNSIRQILTDHLIEDVGSIVTIEDWANCLMPKKDVPFYQFLDRKRKQILADEIKGETELLDAFNLSIEDVSAIKAFLAFPLKQSTHPAALFFSHNSFAIFLAEKLLGVALTKKSNCTDRVNSKKHLISTREVFERVIFGRMKVIYSPAEIIARTAEADWMRGKYVKKRLAVSAEIGEKMFRFLTKAEETNFRRWARDNYTPFTEISELWHPVVQDECRKMCEEKQIHFRSEIGGIGEEQINN